MRQFCEACGERLEQVTLLGRTRDKCPNCGRVHYGQPEIGAGTLIVRDDKLLLLRRTIEPYLGFWNLPAGYAEVDESPSEVLRLAGEGKTKGEIAESLHLSDGTVRNYLSEAISKLGVNNRIEAARLAREKGWL